MGPLSVCILLTLQITAMHCQTCSRAMSYTVWPGYRVSGSELTEKNCAGNPRNCCLVECHRVQTCAGAAMNIGTGLCRLYDKVLTGGQASLVRDDQWLYMEPSSDVVKWEGWVLVFRAHTDINIPVYNTWYNDDLYHDHPVMSSKLQPGCLSADTSLPCDAHFRSRILSTWDTSGIDLVKLVLLKNSNIAAQILFNGTDTNKTSWFLPQQVINSTWTDLTTSTFNFFSIEGDIELRSRRFFINNEYNGCTDDDNWMTVIDGKHSDTCPRDNPPAIPKFLYSTKSTKANTGTFADFDYADVMAILVKQSD